MNWVVFWIVVIVIFLGVLVGLWYLNQLVE